MAGFELLRNFNTGITSEQVANQLKQFPILSIIGFQYCGKSVLAEILHEELGIWGYQVLMQNAKKWLPEQINNYGNNNQTKSSINPEIVFAMTHLTKFNGNGCWIVDDAEIMLSYATEDILINLGKKLLNKEFYLILIRNRFILEDEGWFYKREILLSYTIPKLNIQPLEKETAIVAATSMFQDDYRLQEGKWLASMSGGILGLMSEFYKYTPKWPTEEVPPKIVYHAQKKKTELNLEKPLMFDLLTAICKRFLPPPVFLSKAAKMEMGMLLLSGMVSPAYYTIGGNPLQGHFWEIVAGYEIEKQKIPDKFINWGINLEIMIQNTDYAEAFFQECGFQQDEDALLANSFALCLYCQENFPNLVQSLEHFFNENLGKISLFNILRNQQVQIDIAMSNLQLIDILFLKAKLLS